MSNSSDAALLTRPARKRHRVFVFSAGFMSLLNAIIVAVLTLGFGNMPPTITFLCSFAIFEGVVVVLQLPPLVGRKPLAEQKEVSDTITSVIDAGMAWLIVPAVYVASVYFHGGQGWQAFLYGWYWPPMFAFWVWAIALPATLADFLLLLVLIEIAKTVTRIQMNP